MNKPAKPLPPGNYGRRETASGHKHYPLTQAMIARRHALATALGYTLRNPCSFNAPGIEPKCRFDCYESTPLVHTEKEGYKSANFHHVHVAVAGKYSFGLGPGMIELTWPDDVETAAWAIDKGKPLGHDLADVVEGAKSPAATAPQCSLF